MAHFAELNAENVVLKVIVIANEVLLDKNGIEQEQIGIDFCNQLFGSRWIQTSYNGSFRKNFAGIGFLYDEQKNVFIAPRPSGNGWVLDEESCLWVNPEQEQQQLNSTIGVTRV